MATLTPAGEQRIQSLQSQRKIYEERYSNLKRRLAKFKETGVSRENKPEFYQLEDDLNTTQNELNIIDWQIGNIQQGKDESLIAQQGEQASAKLVTAHQNVEAFKLKYGITPQQSYFQQQQFSLANEENKKRFGELSTSPGTLYYKNYKQGAIQPSEVSVDKQSSIFKETGVNEPTNVLSTSNGISFRLGGIGKSTTPELNFWERLQNVPKRFKDSIKESFGYGNFLELPKEFFSGYGLLDISYGKSKGDKDIPIMPYQTRGTISTIRTTPKTYTDERVADIFASGGTDIGGVARRYEKEITKQYQQKIDTGILDVETATKQAQEEFDKKLSSPEFQIQQNISGRLSEDIFKRSKVSELSVPIGETAGVIFAPTTVGTALGLATVSSSVQDWGKATLGKELTTTERMKLFGSAGIKTGIGMSLIGGGLKSIARSVDVERWNYQQELLREDVKLNIGIRKKLGKYTYDTIKATSKTGETSVEFNVNVLSMKKGKKYLSDIFGTTKTKFFSFETGKGTTTITSFRGSSVGNQLFKPTRQGLSSFFGRGRLQPLQQISFQDLEQTLFRRRVKVSKGNAISLGKSKEETFRFIGMGKETYKGKYYDFVSGEKPSKIDIYETKPLRYYVTTSGKKIISYHVGETYKIKGIDFIATDIGRLKIINLNKIKDTGINFIQGTGRKSSSGYIQSLYKQEQVVIPPIPTSSIIKSLSKSNIIMPPQIALRSSGVFGTSAFTGTGLYERTAGGLAVGTFNNFRTGSGEYQSPIIKPIQLNPQKEKATTGMIQLPKPILITPTREREIQIPGITTRQQTQQTTKKSQRFRLISPKLGRGNYYNPNLNFPTFGFGFALPNLYGKKSKGSKGKFPSFKPPRRTPSLYALGYGIRSRRKGILESSAFTIRPILIPGMRRKRRKVGTTKKK